MPKFAKVTIALGNSSNAPIHTTLQFSSDTKEVDIAPYATVYVRRNSEEARPDSVRLVTVGPAGSLKATGYVVSNVSDYTSSIRFYETPNAVQQNLFATDFHAGDSYTRMLLKNTSNAPLTADASFTPREGPGGSVDLPQITLLPGEIKDVDLRDLRTAQTTRSDMDHVSVRIVNSGSPGSLIGALYSQNEPGISNDVPLRDSGPLQNSTGAYPWRLDQDYKTTVVVTNVGTESTEFTGMIMFNGGQYVVGQHHLEAGETAVFDIAKIRDEQTPDFKGNRIPLNSTSGQFRWSVARTRPSEARLIGRSEVTSPSGQVSISYSCPTCCPYNGTYWNNLPIAFSVAVGETTSYYADGYWLDCYGYPVPEDASVLSLSSGDTNVGTLAVSPDYEDIVLTGVGVGSTTWTATYFFEYYEVLEDYGCTGSGDYRDTGDDMIVTPLVVISQISAVGKDHTATVRVDISHSPANTNFALKLAPKNNTTGVAKFNSNNSDTLAVSCTDHCTSDIVVKGDTESSTKDAMEMTATYTDPNNHSVAVGGPMDFTVIKATLTLRSTDSVSTDNSASSLISTIIGTLTLGGPAMSTGTGQGVVNVIRHRVEAKASLLPANFDQQVTLQREIVEAREYLPSQTLNKRYVSCSDTGTNFALFDRDPQPNGNVYAYDAPGFLVPSDQADGTIARRRVNFRQWLTVNQSDGADFDDVVLSDDLTWYQRLSVKKVSSSSQIVDTSVSGDNVVGTGTTALDWNLAGSASSSLISPCPA